MCCPAARSSRPETKRSRSNSSDAVTTGCAKRLKSHERRIAILANRFRGAEQSKLGAPRSVCELPRAWIAYDEAGRLEIHRFAPLGAAAVSLTDGHPDAR